MELSTGSGSTEDLGDTEVGLQVGFTFHVVPSNKCLSFACVSALTQPVVWPWLVQVGHSRNFTLSPETTDCDSNCGDLDSEVSLLLTDGDTPGLATVRV